MSTIEESGLIDRAESLSELLPGQVVTAHDETWPTARLPWIVNVDQEPFAVVTVHDTEDIVDVVRHARSVGLAVSAQPIGHGATLATSGTIVLRTGALTELSVDPVRRVARVGSGVRWGALQRASEPYGLTGLVGSSHDPTVVGLSLSGGMSWFGRAHGFTANDLLAIELVTSDGEPIRVTADNDPDLFWALRGGGGEFGIVTAVELALHPAPALHGGRMLWPIEQAPAVWHAYLELTAQAPTTVTAWATLLQLPPLPEIPEPLRGGRFVTIDVACLGEADQLERALRPVRSLPAPQMDLTGPLALSALDQVTAEPVEPMPSLHYASQLTRVGDDEVAAILDAVGPQSPSRLLMVQLRHLQGAFADRVPGGGAVPAIDEPYLLMGLGVPFAPGAAGAIDDDLARMRQSIESVDAGRVPYNFFTPGENRARVHPPEVLRRLTAIKADRDPAGVIRSNLPLLAGEPDS